MGGKLKKEIAATAKGGSLCRPCASGWQKWSEAEGGAWSLLQESPELAELGPLAGDLVAVPVRRAFSLSVWIPADDPSVLRDLVLTQLEMRGLAGRTREDTTFDWREVFRAENEVLVHVTVLPPHLAPRYWHGEVIEYAVSASCLPLAENAVSVWNEQGSWAAAVTRAGRILHFQSLSAQVPDAGLILELRMMLAPLEAGSMIEDPLPITIYRQSGEEIDLASLQQHAEVSINDLPPPVRPSVALACVPLAVRELQEKKKKSAQQQRVAFVAAAIYLTLVLALAANTLWLHWQARQLQAVIDREAPDVAATREAMNRWQALQPALEPTTYPLEVLFQTSRLLPKDGVRLTLFEMNLERVVIQGEASTLAAALKFQDDLKKNAELESLYDWTAEAPKQLPNGSTRFQIDGTRRGSGPASKNESADI